MIQNIIQFIINFIEAFFIITFIYLFLKVEIKNKKVFWFQYVILGVLNFIIQQIFMTSSLKTPIVILTYLIIIKIFYKNIKLIKIFYNIILTFIILLTIQLSLSVPYILFFGGNLEILQSNGFMFVLFMSLTFIIEHLIITIIHDRRKR